MIVPKSNPSLVGRSRQGGQSLAVWSGDFLMTDCLRSSWSLLKRTMLQLVMMRMGRVFPHCMVWSYTLHV